ncbi:MAG: DoxX family membrane protein [Bacteroidota bacterium]|nr:DoxX family membrane protein [Bacteroidota bacterium]
MEYPSRQMKWQQGVLVALRFLIGWHILYEGLHKLIHPEWSALAFLANAQGFLSGIAEWMISNPGVLNTVDVLNTWGLILIGLGLILGLFTGPASLAGCALLLFYYLFSPPFIGLAAGGPVEGNYLLINKTLIEAVVLLYVALTPLSRRFGLDMLRPKYRTQTASHDK